MSWSKWRRGERRWGTCRYGEEIQVAARERVAGAPLWISGQPAALFLCDRYALTDDEITAHVRFTRQVIRRMRLAAAGLAPAERAWKPAPDRRSLAETLAHVGDCIWWYPLSSRTTIHVQARFLTVNPEEAWTHAKVCRRQSEHAWEHLQGLARAVQMAAEA